MKIISNFISGIFVGFGIGIIILGLMAVIRGGEKLPEKRVEKQHSMGIDTTVWRTVNCIYVLRLPDGTPIDTVIVQR